MVAGYALLELRLVLLEDCARVGAVGRHRGIRRGTGAGIHGMCGMVTLEVYNRRI